MPKSDFWKHRGHTRHTEPNWPVLAGILAVILLILALTLL